MADSDLVLLVDDEHDILLILGGILLEEGYRVDTATSGEAAVALLDAAGGAYQIVITDIRLGGRVSGWDVGRWARMVNPSASVIYLTGDDDGSPEMAVAGAHLIRKPFPLTDLTFLFQGRADEG